MLGLGLTESAELGSCHLAQRSLLVFLSAETLTPTWVAVPLPQEAFSLLLPSCTGSWAYAFPQPLVTFLEPTLVPPCPSLQGAPHPPALLLSLEMMSCLQLEPCCWHTVTDAVLLTPE